MTAPAPSSPRLMLLTPWFEIGGADLFHLNLIRQLASRGWVVSATATHPASSHPMLADFRQAAHEIHLLKCSKPVAGQATELRRVVGRFKPDVILISHSESGYLHLPYLQYHFPSVAFADFTHLEEAWRGGGYARYSVGLQPFLTVSFTVSHHLKRWMTDRGANPDNIEVCHINVDSRRWKRDPRTRERLRRELAIGPAQTAILFAGRLCDQKQPEILVATLKELARRRMDFRAIIAGDGPAMPHAQSFLREHRLERIVTLTGAVSNDRVRELMAACDIFFLPSRNEGVSLAIYEAMSMGMAVVGTDVGGQRELVDETCGVLISPPTSSNEQIGICADALAELIDDPNGRESLGRAARARIEEHFDLEAMGDRMDERLRQATARPARSNGPLPGRAFVHRWVHAIGRYSATQDLRVLCAPLRAERAHPARLPLEQTYVSFIAGLVADRIVGSPSWPVFRRLLFLCGDGERRLPPSSATFSDEIRAFEILFDCPLFHFYYLFMFLEKLCRKLRNAVRSAFASIGFPGR